MVALLPDPVLRVEAASVQAVGPGVVLAAQVNRLKSELVARLKMEGVEYEERMERLAEVRPPQPLAEFLYGTFDVFRAHHPWVGDENVRPKSVAREMFELGYGFRDYIAHHGLKRSEGTVLRYLTDAYKGLVQNVPPAARTEAVADLEAWLGETVRQVDSSLLEEWERLRDPDEADGDAAAPAHPLDDRPDVTAAPRAFRVMVRNEVFRWVQLLARREHEALAEVPAAGGGSWTAGAVADAFAPYWEDFDDLPTDAHARGAGLFVLDDSGGVAADAWPVTQTVADPEGFHEWVLEGAVDLPASREEGRAVVALTAIRRL